MTRPATNLNRENPSSYSVGEEWANSLSHGVGVVLGIAGLSVLVSMAALQGDAWKVVSAAVYGTTLIAMYLASTLYHSLPAPRLKRRFRILDHATIYLLIAGTYTPLTLISLRGPWGWSLFGAIWGMAMVGIMLKIFLTGRFKRLSSLVYIGMGWLILIAIKPSLAVIPPGGMGWLLVGGLCYTGGVAFYLWQSLPYHHAVWHLFVLAGSVCHFLAVLFYILP